MAAWEAMEATEASGATKDEDPNEAGVTVEVDDDGGDAHNSRLTYSFTSFRACGRIEFTNVENLTMWDFAVIDSIGCYLRYHNVPHEHFPQDIHVDHILMFQPIALLDNNIV